MSKKFPIKDVLDKSDIIDLDESLAYQIRSRVHPQNKSAIMI